MKSVENAVMYKQLFFVAALCVAVYAAKNEEEARSVKNDLEQMEREISRWKDDSIRETNEKIDWKVKQASQRGPKSEACARTAGRRFKDDVESALKGEVSEVHEKLKSALKEYDEHGISKSDYENLKAKFERALTNTGAKIEGLGLAYAKTANEC